MTEETAVGHTAPSIQYKPGHDLDSSFVTGYATVIGLLLFLAFILWGFKSWFKKYRLDRINAPLDNKMERVASLKLKGSNMLHLVNIEGTRYLVGETNQHITIKRHSQCTHDLPKSENTAANASS